MDILLVILLVIVGVALVVAEIFLLPGISVAGIAGVACLGGAVTAAYIYLGAVAGHITLGVSLVLCVICVWAFIKHRTLDKMALKTDITSKVDMHIDQRIHIGDDGICISRLAPMGKVRVNGEEAEAKSQDEFIDAGTEITVIAIEGNKIIVKQKV